MQEVRCKKCGKLLYKLYPRSNGEAFGYEPTRAIDVDYFAHLQGRIECKCPRCGEMNTKKESVKNGKETGVKQTAAEKGC